MKHYENFVASVTGDFVREMHIGTEIKKNEYTLSFEGEKVRVEWKERDFDNLPLAEYWDGKQQWEIFRPDNFLFKVEITPNKESTVLEKVQQAFKQVGIKITGDVHIASGDLPNSYKVSEKDKTYIVLFVGDTTLEVYDGDVGYSVRPEWTIVPPDIDPRFWLTYPRIGSDNSYLSEPLWQLLEKHESELIGSEILDGEMTSVIHLTKPARTIGDHEIPPHRLKLWISPTIGFRLVKLERKYISEDGAYIHTREIDYHEYLPNVWFPKRIEISTVPEKPPNPQKEANFIFKNVLITKQCKINTDVSRLLRLDLSTDTAIFDDKSGHQLTIDDLEVKPNFQMMLANSNIPTKNSGLKRPISDFTSQETLKWHLPEGAKTRIGKGWIDKIEYSQDGKLLAVVSSIGIWLYDAHTGQELDLLIKHSVQVQSVAFSPDGKTLISGNSDSTIHIWDIQTHTLQNTFKGHTDSVLSVVFSSDGSSLASGSKDNTICLWDVQTGKLQKKLKGHTNTVISVVFDPKGGTLASGGKDNTLRLWDAETGTLQETIDLVEYTEIMEMAFSPDGKTLAAWDWGTIHLWDVETGVIEKTLKEQERDVVYDIAFNPDGKTIASAMGNGTIRLWHTQTWEQHRILIGHKDHVYSITFSPDGKTLTSGGFDGTLRWWDLETGECRNTRTGHNSDTIDVSYSPDGKTIASAMDNGTVGLWNAQTGMLLHTLKVLHIDSESINSVSFGPDGKTLAGGGYGRVIHLWDVETGERQNVLNGHDTVASVAFSTDGKILASASWDSTIRLWDTETDTIRHTFEEHTDWVNSVVFSPDGNTLVSGSTDKTVNLWNTQTGELHKTLTGHTDEVTSVAFNPNGNIIASGSKDGTIHLWDAQMGEIQKTLTKHTNAVSRVAFSPDGKTLVSRSLDKTIHLWDVETGKHRNTLTGHTQWVSCVAFSPNGNTLVSGSRDGTLLLWDITPMPTN